MPYGGITSATSIACAQITLALSLLKLSSLNAYAFQRERSSDRTATLRTTHTRRQHGERMPPQRYIERNVFNRINYPYQLHSVPVRARLQTIEYQKTTPTFLMCAHSRSLSPRFGAHVCVCVRCVPSRLAAHRVLHAPFASTVFRFGHESGVLCVSVCERTRARRICVCAM